MPNICICLAKDPLLSVYAYKPGEKINIQVMFDHFSEKPERYRLQILDHKRNPRLNRYGRGLDDIFVYDWPIPASIRSEHLGVWQIRVDRLSKNKEKLHKRLEETIATQIFFVEEVERVEFPLLEGREVPLIPIEIVIPEVEITTTGEAVLDAIPTDYRSVVDDGTEINIGQTPVTTIRGIGQTYAARLAKIKVYSVSDFWYYKDRIYLAEVMKVSDQRLTKILQDAEIILSEEADQISRVEVEKLEEFVPDDLTTVYGINTKLIKKLASIGINSKTDLLDYEDLVKLRKTLKVSHDEMKKILASVGRIIEPEKVRKPISLEPREENVTKVKGIGVVTARKLSTVDIVTVGDLLESKFSTVEKVTTEKTYMKWMQSAADFADVSVEITPSIDVLKEEIINELLEIRGIGPKTVEKLNSLGITTKKQLVDFEDQEKVRKALRMSLNRFRSFIKSLIVDKR
jgi:predicted flap endonuclease-1-like 5' DNA nuclease